MTEQDGVSGRRIGEGGRPVDKDLLRGLFLFEKLEDEKL
jgi:hypothetical protein